MKLPIKGFEGLYSIDDNGIIISYNYMNKGVIRVLNQYDNGTGYMYVVLQKDKKRVKKYVHRLVLSAFNGESNLEVNHKNFNRKDNNINNLEYVTKSGNAKHRQVNNRITRNSKGQFTG